MAIKTFYIKDAIAGSSQHGSLQDGGVAPSTTTSGTGWTVGTENNTQYCLQDYGSKRDHFSFNSTVVPSTGPNTSDCWRTESTLSGTFDIGSWTIAIAVRSVSASASGSGRLRCRVWRSVNQNGSSATQITSGTITTNQWSNLSTGTTQNLTATFSPGSIVLNGEYLFLQIACEIDNDSFNSSADVLIRVSSTGSVITTTNFTSGTIINGSATIAGSADVLFNINGNVLPHSTSSGLAGKSFNIIGNTILNGLSICNAAINANVYGGGNVNSILYGISNSEADILANCNININLLSDSNLIGSIQAEAYPFSEIDCKSGSLFILSFEKNIFITKNIPQTLQYFPGQKCTCFLEITGTNLEVLSSLTPPIVSKIIFPNLTLAYGYPINMTKLFDGLYYYSFWIPKGATAIGDYLVYITYTNPDNNLINSQIYQVVVNAPFGTFGMTSN